MRRTTNDKKGRIWLEKSGGGGDIIARWKRFRRKNKPVQVRNNSDKESNQY